LPFWHPRLRTKNRHGRQSELMLNVSLRDDFLKAEPGEAGRSVLTSEG
jgi:hypothetical protein